MTSSKAVLIAALMLGAASSAFAQQAAQTPPATAGQPAQPAAPARTFDLNGRERTTLSAVQTALTARDWATAQTALAAAEAVARGADARYVVGQFRVQIGVGTQNQQLQAQGVGQMIASGGAQAGELVQLYTIQMDLANTMNDRATADRALAELMRLTPNDTNLLARAAQQRVTANDVPGAIALYQQAIQRQTASNQPVPADWRLRIASIAYRARLPETLRYMREWLVAAPSQVGWHDSLTIYVTFNDADNPLKLDIYRLMRAAGAMTSEGDFMNYWRIANGARLFGEAKTALEEGLNRRLIIQGAADAQELLRTATARVADDRTSFAEGRAGVLAGSNGQAALDLGDIYYSYGQYADAVTLYRAALQKGADANVANLRLGAALAQAGQRAEAEAAFRAVGAGSRAELAQYWLLWLSTRPA